MPHHESAKKRLRQNARRRLNNVARKSRLKTEIKKFKLAVEEKQLDIARVQLRVVSKLLDQASGKNVIHKNLAARTKSRLTISLNKISVPAPAETPASPTA